MKKSDNIVLLVTVVIIGLLIALGIDYKNKMPMTLSSSPSAIEMERYIKGRVQKHIEKSLTKGEKYTGLKWEMGGYTDAADQTTVYSGGTFSVPSSKWSKLVLSHTFIITNKEGCESHYCKQIIIDKQGNITNFTNQISGEDYTGIEQITGFIQGPLRNSDNEELIIWGEDVIRNYIHGKMAPSQKYIPIKWILYTKLTLNQKVFDALDITFSPVKRIGNFHPDWIHAALCIEHKYSIEGRNGYKQTRHSVFIISPKGKVKEVSFDYFSISKSAEEQYKLLFTNFY